VREPARIQLEHADTDRAVDEVRRPLVELARDPFINGRDFDVELQPNVPRKVPTGLGRRFVSYSHSAPRGGAGASCAIVETARDDASVTLEAVTAGAAVTITMRVW
jgi:hypothetical protein